MLELPRTHSSCAPPKKRQKHTKAGPGAAQESPRMLDNVWASVCNNNKSKSKRQRTSKSKSTRKSKSMSKKARK